MNRNELVSVMAEKSGISIKETGACLDAFFEVLATRIAQDADTLSIPGWIKVERRTTQAREVRKPGTNDMVHVAAKNTLKVSIGKKLKDAANA